MRQTASQPCQGAFRARSRRDGQTHLNKSSFDLTVDLSAHKKHQTRDIELGEKNNHRAKGSIRQGIVIKEMKVETEAERGQEPSQQAQ